MSNGPETALSKGAERKTYVKGMFNNIAHRYDFLNHFLSAGIDIYWRKKAISKIDVGPDGHVLDLASGTGDMAFEIVKQKKCRVTAVDFAQNMLVLAMAKVVNKNLGEVIFLVNGDGEQLPFKDNSFEAATVAFGIRNMGDIPDALDEMFRLLRSEGRAVILEFSLPANKLFRKIYLFYFLRLLPLIGRIFSKDKDAYSYLPASVQDFPEINEFENWMRIAGFSDIQSWKLLNGVAVIYKGIKQSG